VNGVSSQLQGCEQAQQIHEEARPLAAAFGCRTTCVFGGMRKYLQEREVLMLGGELGRVAGDG